MLENYIYNLMKANLEDCKIVPFNWITTKIYSVSFSGWGDCEIVNDDSTFNEIIQMANHTLAGIVSMYKDTHAFTEPHFMYNPDKETFCIQIATLEIEQYNRLMELEDK